MKKLMVFAIRSLIVVPAFLWIFSSVGQAATIQVDCFSASIQAAVAKAKPGDTLFLGGTCKENLAIYEEVARVTLDGQGKTTIEGADARKPTIVVRGRGITIKGFTVTGGLQGIAVQRGGQAVIDGNTVQGAAFGISVASSSSALITNSTVQNNRANGIVVAGTSSATIVNNTIQNNRAVGIVISNNSYANVGSLRSADKTASPNVIQNNGRAGIEVNLSSSARIVGNTIRNNKLEGIVVWRVSRANVRSNTIDGNGGAGILVYDNSSVGLGIGSSSVYAGYVSDAEINRPHGLPNSTGSNNAVGIRCTSASSVDGRLGSLNGNNGVKDINPSCVDSLAP